ncbi:hypothetical protein ACFVXQ_26390 [Kitasatospora sp. NPDC058263]
MDSTTAQALATALGRADIPAEPVDLADEYGVLIEVTSFDRYGALYLHADHQFRTVEWQHADGHGKIVDSGSWSIRTVRLWPTTRHRHTITHLRSWFHANDATPGRPTLPPITRLIGEEVNRWLPDITAATEAYATALTSGLATIDDTAEVLAGLYPELTTRHRLAEDGRTDGWDDAVFSLRALAAYGHAADDDRAYELTDTYGPGTLATLRTQFRGDAVAAAQAFLARTI